MSTQKAPEFKNCLAGRMVDLPGFDPYFAWWLERLSLEGKRAGTVAVYARSVANCVESLRSVCQNEISMEVFSKLHADTFRKLQRRIAEEGKSDGTIRVQMAALRSFGKFLDKSGYAQSSNLLSGSRVPLEKRRSHTPTEDDCAVLASAAISDVRRSRWELLRNRVILRLLLHEKLSISEVLAIDRAHLDLEACCILILGTRRSRTIDISHEVLDDIVAYMKACPYESRDAAPLFLGPCGVRLVARTIQKYIRTLSNQLGLHEETTGRSIRKSGVLQLARQGVSAQEIMRQVGVSATCLGRLLNEVPITPALLEAGVFEVNSNRLRCRCNWA